ncbi:carboxymuconolactone decarboxylase family protein [Nocardioides cavernaquae]|uniref:Carboxymuconolactone decarboxylase family protein n=1 Tax=Nocardioides cavernaquae TaxID=2321396 RepID=A0A3A5HC21_9ACTN|nr:carboxymuconolactone decarboxylase family protein [Nocardioides cavernaquae]RJS47822.1 carboxymuconolactone decarboxylase family protein [Nocardioides cavernaquae]
MDPLFLDKASPDIYGHLMDAARAAGAAAAAAGLDRRLVELVSLRVSQLNGCSYCLDVHTARALKAGETPQRLGVLPAWAEAGLYTEIERAALELAEAITVLPHPEERLDLEFRVREVLSDAEYAAVAWLAISMNAFNRISITSRHPVTPRK